MQGMPRAVQREALSDTPSGLPEKYWRFLPGSAAEAPVPGCEKVVGAGG